MGQTDKRPVAVGEVVGKVALAQAIVNRVAAAMDVEHVFDEVVNEEEDVDVVDVFGGLGQIVCFVGLGFERRIVLPEMPGAECCLWKRLLRREHVLYQRVWAGQRAGDPGRIRTFVVVAKLNTQQAGRFALPSSLSSPVSGLAISG